MNSLTLNGNGWSEFPVNSDGPSVLAVGGELKNRVCFLHGKTAYFSPSHGDLKGLDEYELFMESLSSLKLRDFEEPLLVVHDLHPEYLSTKWAREQSLPLLGVQHHHAHLASCMAERNLSEPVIGIAMDGTGYGTDGTIWGAEVLVGGYEGFRRFASLEPMPLPGGDQAVREPWRTGVGYLASAFREIPELPFLAARNWKPIEEITRRKVGTPLTSSCGRLFDAVSAICGVRGVIGYEGEAAIELMRLAESVEGEEPYSVEMKEDETGILRFLVSSVIRKIVDGLRQNVGIGRISSRFHETLACFNKEVALRCRESTAINTVVLSGGVFQNEILLKRTAELLERERFAVKTHREIPTNDAGICLGQAMIGRESLKRLRG